MRTLTLRPQLQGGLRSRPAWREIRPDPAVEPTLARLDAGERAAIALALSVDADRLLIDEKTGRIEAERRGLAVTGTLGVLAAAHTAGLLDFDHALAQLHATNFRLDPDIEEIVRRRFNREK